METIKNRKELEIVTSPIEIEKITEKNRSRRKNICFKSEGFLGTNK